MPLQPDDKRRHSLGDQMFICRRSAGIIDRGRTSGSFPDIQNVPQ
jgi:hypothetical protein